MSMCVCVFLFLFILYVFSYIYFLSSSSIYCTFLFIWCLYMFFFIYFFIINHLLFFLISLSFFLSSFRDMWKREIEQREKSTTTLPTLPPPHCTDSHSPSLHTPPPSPPDSTHPPQHCHVPQYHVVPFLNPRKTKSAFHTSMLPNTMVI